MSEEKKQVWFLQWGQPLPPPPRLTNEQITEFGTVKRVAEQLGNDPTLVLQLHYCAHRAAFVATYVGATEERATAHHHNLHDALRAVVATLEICSGSLPTRERPTWAQVTAMIESGTADGSVLLALLRKAAAL